jgi:hypothetical protein
VSGSLVADLGVGPEVWLFLSLLGCVTLFFKFTRIWSVRNLDLLLMFALAPGMMLLVGHEAYRPWIAFLLLFIGSGLLLVRCLVDLGLARRPVLEPNLNAAGLACLSIGMLVLLVVETVNLPVHEGVARNPADPGAVRPSPPPVAGTLEADAAAAVTQIASMTPLPETLKANTAQVILSRVLASLAHLALAGALIAVGWRHFERPIAGLAMSACYLISPYTRIALVDSGQLVPAALIVGAIAAHTRPVTAGVLIGMAAGWMPACLGLVVLWAGFYRGGRDLKWFVASALLVVVTSAALAWAFPGLAAWSRALGARSLAEAGLLPQVEPPASGSFWSGIEGNYRLPVLIVYLALVVLSAVLPARKNLGELIALTAALLVASQFWYLDRGGTLVLLYLPLILLMMFRPTLAVRRPLPRPARQRPAREPISPAH